MAYIDALSQDDLEELIGRYIEYCTDRKRKTPVEPTFVGFYEWLQEGAPGYDPHASSINLDDIPF